MNSGRRHDRQFAAVGRQAVSQSREDHGQVLLLVVGLAIIVIALIAVVVDASRVFLHRRALAAAADGAVTAAVQAADEAAIYGEANALATGMLPLDEAEARVAVEAYVIDHGLPGRFQDLSITAVDISPDGTTVTVIFSARVDLPFTAFLPSRLHNVTITAAATARAPTG